MKLILNVSETSLRIIIIINNYKLLKFLQVSQTRAKIDTMISFLTCQPEIMIIVSKCDNRVRIFFLGAIEKKWYLSKAVGRPRISCD